MRALVFPANHAALLREIEQVGSWGISDKPYDDDGFAAFAQLESREVARWSAPQSVGEDGKAKFQERRVRVNRVKGSASRGFFRRWEVGFDPRVGLAPALAVDGRQEERSSCPRKRLCLTRLWP